MDWLNRMNNAMNYIESNLASKISYDKTAQIACCSTYHFQRMFSFITGVPLSEYIKRRRLTLAAFELQSGAKVIDVALKYGYDAPESFSRAFKMLYGITPSLVCKNGVKLKAYPRISFHISIKGDIEMNYKIEEKPAFTVFGVSRKLNRTNDELGAFWAEMCNSGELGKIESLSKTHSCGIMWHGENGEPFYYSEEIMPCMIGSFKSKGVDTTGYTEVNIPTATWAVFQTEEASYESGKIAEYIRATFDRIWSEWFPTSGYEHGKLPELEVYIGTGTGEYVEVWMPVRRKK